MTNLDVLASVSVLVIILRDSTRNEQREIITFLSKKRSSTRQRRHTQTYHNPYDSGRRKCMRCGKMSSAYHRDAVNCK